MPESVTTGDVHISHDVLAELAGYAAMESYGVVGMAAKSKTAEVVQLLSRDKLARGVEVTAGDDGDLRVDLWVVIEYGTNIAEVAKNLIGRVQHVISTYAGVQVSAVEVHVQDIKVRE